MHHRLRSFLSTFCLTLLSIVLFTGLTQTSQAFAPPIPPVTSTQAISDLHTPDGVIIAQIDGAEQLLASNGFNPQTDSFSFENYGGKPPLEDYNKILPSSFLVQLFGPDGVCQNQSDSSGNCILTAPAEHWRQKQIDNLSHGRCEGMAVASLLLWLADHRKKVPYAPPYIPTTTELGGAGTVSELTKDKAERLINFYFLLQSLQEVADRSAASRLQPPAQLLQWLIQGIQQDFFYTIGVYRGQGNFLTQGHSLTPYAVKQMNDGSHRVYVYDSNYAANETNSTNRYLTINPDQTWNYTTEIEGQTLNYEGNATTQNLELTSFRDRGTNQNGRYYCPFCQDASTVKFSFIGEAQMEVAWVKVNDDQTLSYQRAGGYNPQTQDYFKEIPRTQFDHVKGGLGRKVYPSIRIPQVPYTQADLIPAEVRKYYQVKIWAKDWVDRIKGDLFMTGPSFVLGYEGIDVSPDKGFVTTISPDALGMAIKAFEETELSNIFYATDAPDDPDVSYLFELGELSLEENERVDLRINPSQLTVSLKQSGEGSQDTYDLSVTRISKDEAPFIFESEKLTRNSQCAQVDFSNYRGGNDEIMISVDSTGDGSCDTAAAPVKGGSRKKASKK
ncbi:MAG: hypothetical protein K6T90_11330 [Leptolyngbyaceae cyanobacterium HOT.MB2.61]|nr:hypothetical protein [Leptolyngbyaceae cyanobacterium HOT.MB2.61]